MGVYVCLYLDEMITVILCCYNFVGNRVLIKHIYFIT